MIGINHVCPQHHHTLLKVWTEFDDYCSPIPIQPYFEQDFQMYHEEGELHGGIRGICWRLRNQLDPHDIDHIANNDDTKFMFNITQLLMQSPVPSNRLL